MGRYYYGDIEGKFWFAVQSSTDAENFGGDEEEIYDEESEEPIGMSYYFNEEHLPSINKGLQECLDNLGEAKDKLDKFFSENTSYNAQMIEEQTGIPVSETGLLLAYYARYELGMKIKECVEKEGVCSFDADYN